MAIDLTLAGISRRWRLQDDDAVQSWAGARPWLGPGSTLSVVVPGAVEGVHSWLRRTIWAWDLGVSEVRVVELSIEQRTSFLSTVASWLGIASGELYPVARALGAELAIRPAVFLLLAPDATVASRTFEMAEELRDWIGKLDHRRGSTSVIVHPGRTGLVRGSLRADIGWPVAIVDDLLAAPTTEERWKLYLHLRIACEVSGRIDEAHACDEAGFDQLACGDDAGCEQALNRHAVRRLASMPAAEAAAWRSRSRGGDWRGPPLTVEGQPWKSLRSLTPAPWLARALLQEPGAIATRRRLRAELICRPLADSLLTMCFALEAAQRARLGGTRTDHPDEQAVAQFDRFASNRPSTTRDLYPAGHPAPPMDAWDFASLGSVQRVLDGDPELLQLRNALAHGHYAGWNALCRLHELQRRALV